MSSAARAGKRGQRVILAILASPWQAPTRIMELLLL